MASRKDMFLQLYREYEAEVRNLYACDPKVYEGNLDGLTCDRMRMVRSFRNYLTHSNDPGFLEPTDKMMSVLEDMIKVLRYKHDTVKKHVKRPSVCVCSENDKCHEALTRVLGLETERVVVTTESGYAVYSIFDLTRAVLTQPKSTRVRDIKPMRCKPAFVSPFMAMGEINRDLVNICTLDGTPEGKLVGVVFA